MTMKEEARASAVIGFAELAGAKVGAEDVRPEWLDGNGGVALRLLRATSAVVDTPGLRALDLIGCPELQILDLRALQASVHLTVRGCPRLEWIGLPSEGAAHVHLDAGEAPRGTLRIEGGVEQFDACWEEAGQLLRRVPRRITPWGRVLFGGDWVELWAGPPVPEKGNRGLVILVGVPPTEPGGSELVLGAGSLPQCDLVIHQPAEGVRTIDWQGGALGEFGIEGATGLATVKTSAPVRHLWVSNCPVLRHITSLREPINSVSVAGCCAAPKDRTDLSHGQAHDAGRARSFLAVDAPCQEVSLLHSACARLRVFWPCELRISQCTKLRRVRLDPGSTVELEGTLPDGVIDCLTEASRRCVVDEGLIGRLKGSALRGEPRAWKRFSQACLLTHTPRSRVAALQALCSFLHSDLSRSEVWRLRCQMYRSQREARGLRTEADWTWDFPADLLADGYIADFRIWAGCKQSQPLEQHGKLMSSYLTRDEGSAVVEAFLPWLARNPMRQALPFLGAVLRQAARREDCSQAMREAAGKVLPALIKSLSGGAGTRVDEALLRDAAWQFFLRRARPWDQIRWLEFEMQRDPVGTAMQIHELLQAPVSPAVSPISPQHRHALQVLMMMRRLPHELRVV
jgi:hypothetical protein